MFVFGTLKNYPVNNDRVDYSDSKIFVFKLSKHIVWMHACLSLRRARWCTLIIARIVNLWQMQARRMRWMGVGKQGGGLEGRLVMVKEDGLGHCGTF